MGIKMNKIEKIIKLLKERYGYPNFSKNKFKLLITTVLSQRTRDKNTAKASKKLFSLVDGPKDILNLPRKKLQKLIKKSGMYRQKSKRIKKISETLLEKYEGEVPGTREELMKLPGVGFKTSAIVMMYGFKEPIIAVDVHVAVCAQRLGLTKHKDPEKIRKDLEKIIPKNKWYLVNSGFVQFGKEICRTRNPKCEECPLKEICDYWKNK